MFLSLLPNYTDSNPTDYTQNKLQYFSVGFKIYYQGNDGGDFFTDMCIRLQCFHISPGWITVLQTLCSLSAGGC